MTYIIYADVMLVWNIVINFTVIFIASMILKIRANFKRISLFSIITAVITTLEYIITINLNKYIHHIVYAGIYVFMIGIYFKSLSIKGILSKCMVVLGVMFLVNGAINILYPFQINSLVKILPFIFIFILVVKAIFMYSGKQIQTNENKFKLILDINSKKINLIGYLDTGNSLKDPYTGAPVIILDYRVLKNIINENAYRYIVNYHNTGEFNYMEIGEICNLNFYPLPYKTISTNFALMPAFKINSITFDDFNMPIQKIVCGISRFKLKNNNDYQVLLNESLKPNREETFK